MGAVGVRLRAELRASWRSWLVLAVLIGAFGGAVLGVATGARRTATAFPRFVEASHSSAGLVGAFRNGANDYYRQLGADRAVATYGKVVGLPIFPAGPDGEPVPLEGNVMASVDGRVGYSIDRSRVLSGRLPRLDAPDEAFLNEVAAARLGVHVGSRMPMVLVDVDQTQPGGPPRSITPIGDITVVGIGRSTSEVVATSKFDVTELILVSPAAYKAWGHKASVNWDGIYVRLRDGASMDTFSARAKALAQAQSEAVGGDVLIANNADRDRHVNSALRPQAAALALFAAFAGLAGLFVLGQALARQLTDDATEAPILRALGLTRGQLMRLTLLRTTVIAGLGALIAVGVAVALSPLFPIGAARRAEAHPGLAVNVAFLAAGAGVLLFVLVARALVPAWRLSGVPAGVQGAAAIDAGRPSVLARRVASTSLPATATAGIRMALEPGRGRTAVPVRATLVGAIVGLAAVTTTVVFAANLDRVVATPRLYGRTFDMIADGDFGPIPLAGVRSVLRGRPLVTRWSGGYYGEAAVAGHPVSAVGIEGPLGPVVVAGRRPQADDEVVLGSKTLEASHAHVGQRVQVTVAGETRSMRIVGRAVFPAFGRGAFVQTGLGEGVLMTADALRPPFDPESGDPPPGTWFSFYLFQLRGGTSVAQEHALIAELRKFCPPDQNCQILGGEAAAGVARPAEIATLGRIRWTPVVLAGLLAALAVATVGHTLVTSIRRRRRDLALLKTMGFRRGQVSATVAWQATTFATVALIGLPLGVALGRVLWRVLANQLGIVPEVTTPVVALLVAVPITLVIANVLAVVPGWMAGRVKPAVALRSE